MQLKHFDNLFNKEQIKKIEETKNARYVGEFTLRHPDGGWANNPVAIFIQEEPHAVSNSRFFGLYNKINIGTSTGDLVITDGQAAVTNKDGTRVLYTGIKIPGGDEVLYSAFNHDYQHYKGVVVDGGSQADSLGMRCSAPSTFVSFYITDEGGIHFLGEGETLDDVPKPKLIKKEDLTGWSIKKTLDIK